jgi:hypothetical protein
MQLVSTDDASRRLQFIWKGPANSPWPFDARGQMWVVAGAASLVFVPLLYLVIPASAFAWLVLPPTMTRGLLALALGMLAAVALTRQIGRVISPTTPLRHHVALVVAELDTPRPDGPAATYELDVGEGFFLEGRAQHRQVHVIEAPTFVHDTAGPTAYAREYPS